MKFNQREIFELKELVSAIKVSMTLTIDSDSLALDYANDNSIQSILRKRDKEYNIDYTNSSGVNNHFSTDDWDKFKYRIRSWIQNIKRDNPHEIDRKGNVQELSSNFYTIFQEANIIYGLNFKDSSGMIYRKALEILVKDFLKKHLPIAYENIIMEKTIGQIIVHFYEKKNNDLIARDNAGFENIKQQLDEIIFLAKSIGNIFKIGNDFSHYERKLAHITPLDMKAGILDIEKFIDNQIEREKLINRQSELNNKFDRNSSI